MTMRVLSTLLLATTLLFIGCKKKQIDNPPDPTETKEIQIVSGTIDPPSGTSTDLWTVASSVGESGVTGNGFELDVYGQYSGLYVSNSNDEVIMMGYTYPGDTENEINATSTALGLLLNSPVGVQLTDQAKETFIENVLNDNSLQALLGIIEQGIDSERDLFDTTNTALITAINEVFQSASFKTSSIQQELPVLMNYSSSGKLVSFTNNAKSYSTVISLYKGNDTVPLDRKVVRGVNLVSNSISDILSGKGSTFEDPEVATFTLGGDGDYTFRIRTGLPFKGDNTKEHDEAFWENVGLFSYNMLKILTPFVDPDEKGKCTKPAIIRAIFEMIEPTVDVLDYQGKSVGSILYDVYQLTLNSIKNIPLVECLPGVDKLASNPEGLIKIAKHWNFFDRAFNLISNGANTIIHASQWTLAESVVDTCFRVDGNTISPGGCSQFQGTWKYVSNEYNGVVTTINCPDSFVGWIVSAANIENVDYFDSQKGDYCAELITPGSYPYSITGNTLNFAGFALDIIELNSTTLRIDIDPGNDVEYINFERQ